MASSRGQHRSSSASGASPAKSEAETAAEDVAALISEASELANSIPAIAASMCDWRLPTACRRCFVDKVQVQQVLLNLLRNAFEATEGASHEPSRPART